MKSNRYVESLRYLKGKFGFDFASIACLVDEQYHMLSWMYATGNQSRRYRRIVVEAGQGIAGSVFLSGKAMIIQNACQELNEDELLEHPIILAEDLVSEMAVPLWKEGKVKGVLLLAKRTENLITRELFERVLKELENGFCDYELKSVLFDQALRAGAQSKVAKAPIYELMNFPILRAKEEAYGLIAKGLHDSVVQNIMGVQMLLRTFKYQKDPEDAERLLDEVDKQLTDIQNELRTISSSLHPVILDDLGLVAALNSYFKRLETNYRLKVVFEQNVEGQRFSREIETAYYRICQEAVMNACKYAGSDHVMVLLEKTDGFLIMEIVDRGIGFDMKAPVIKGTGFGLSDMYEWAEMADGKLQIQSEPGLGTKVSIAVQMGKERVV